MHRYEARISWNLNGGDFAGNRYSRSHEWSFDGGAKVEASSSPSIVPVPYSAAEAVDPEEALVASTSSCHMLWFLALAAGRGFVVESYTDEAFGVMEKNPAGRLAFSRISLRPTIRFSTQKVPSEKDLAALHHAAHDRCFIANSLKCEVRVEAPHEDAAADRSAQVR